ncbi:hypothetical protein V493_06166 [Pseudogymnoascus sp. VKM F-4281 (FW-2241)]|nr:hypothetical protein V493_06166 [Pseudogymnoascus sp. VKM F-4281 (FW-2241)]
MTLTDSKLPDREAVEANNPVYIGIWDDPAFIASCADVINGGSISLIHLLPCGRIRKDVYPKSSDKRFNGRLEIESRIYGRLLKKHPRLFEMFSYSPQRGAGARVHALGGSWEVSTRGGFHDAAGWAFVAGEGGGGDYTDLEVPPLFAEKKFFACG